MKLTTKIFLISLCKAYMKTDTGLKKDAEEALRELETGYTEDEIADQKIQAIS